MKSPKKRTKMSLNLNRDGPDNRLAGYQIGLLHIYGYQVWLLDMSGILSGQNTRKNQYPVHL